MHAKFDIQMYFLSKKSVFIIIVLFITLSYAYCSYYVPFNAIADAGHDDALFVRLGASISSGDWLGPFNQFTLLKGSGFPIWLALLHKILLPVVAAEFIFYAITSLFLLLLIFDFKYHSVLFIICYLLLLFNPMLMHNGNLRVTRELLYTPLTLLLIVGPVLLFKFQNTNLWLILAVVFFFGLVTGFYETVREEGVWIYPFLANSCVLIILVEINKNNYGYRACLTSAIKYSLVITVFLIMHWVPVCFVSQLNKKNYNIAAPTITKYEPFLYAYNAFTRVKIGNNEDYIIVKRSTLDQLVLLSPALKLISQDLKFDSALSKSWSESDCADFNISPCDMEFRPKFEFFFMDALYHAGIFNNGIILTNYLNSISSDIDYICQSSLISCGKRSASMMPDVSISTIFKTILEIRLALKSLIFFDNMNIYYGNSTGNIDNLIAMRSFVSGISLPASSDGDKIAPKGKLTMCIFEFFDKISNFYKNFTYFGIIIFLVNVCLKLDAWLKGNYIHRPFSDICSFFLTIRGFCIINCILLILTRITLLCFLKVTSFPDPINPLYLSCLYPLVILIYIIISVSTVNLITMKLTPFREKIYSKFMAKSKDVA